MVRVENMLAKEPQRRKVRERKTRKQTKLKKNVNSTAVLDDNNNAFAIFNKLQNVGGGGGEVSPNFPF